MWSRLPTTRPARRPFATVAPLGSCRSSTSVPTVPMSRTELDSSLLHGISTGRGVVGVLAVLRGAPEVTPAWQRRRDERRQAAPAAGVEGRVLGAEATARIAIFFSSRVLFSPVLPRR
jgi:hypothetical protein